MFYIYALIFPNGKRYIGATRNVARRAIEHRYALNSNQKHYNAGVQQCWDQYGTFEIVILQESTAKRSAHPEQNLIDAVPAIYRLNRARATERNRGRKPSAEQSRLMQAGRKKLTDVQRARMADAKRGTGMPVVNKTTGQVFANARCAAESVGVAQVTMLNAVRIGRPKTIKGHVWRRVGAADFVYPPKKKKQKLGRTPNISKEGAARKAAATRAAKNRAVRNLDTGEIYPSIVAAAAAMGLARSNLSCALSAKHRQKTFAGYRWAFV